jgi:serine/threonine protein kinase
MSIAVNPMSSYPDISAHGYQINQQLGYNYKGGRFTYQAVNLETQESVVIKQFRFVTDSGNGSASKSIERELQALLNLNHPGIPRYLDCFDPGNGICLVQEYKDAQPLSVPHSLNLDEIKHIAVSVLEILSYLQSRTPSIIHQNIKPEHILVDEQLHVYLVDLGLPEIGNREVVETSSKVAGTTGFLMTPEQWLNRPLTKASDLYVLGATLICLLTGTKSTEIGDIIDGNFRINFKPFASQFSLEFIEWLDKMVHPKLNERFDGAESALEALKPLSLIRTPTVELSQLRLEFEASYLGEKLTQTVEVGNSVPETVLEGNWEVAPHLSDPPHTPDCHAWISFNPTKFASNLTECAITVNTSKLIADRVYERQLLLHTNAVPETHTLTVKVKMPPQPIQTRQPPYRTLIWLLVASLLGAFVGAKVVGTGVGGTTVGTAAAVGVTIGAETVAVIKGLIGAETIALVGAAAVVACGLVITAAILLGSGAVSGVLWIGTCLVVAAVLLVMLQPGSKTITTIKNFLNRGFTQGFAILLLLLTAGVGICLGITLALGVQNFYTLLVLLGTGLPLAAIFLYTYFKRRRSIVRYRQGERQVIKP